MIIFDPERHTEKALLRIRFDAYDSNPTLELPLQSLARGIVRGHFQGTNQYLTQSEGLLAQAVKPATAQVLG